MKSKVKSKHLGEDVRILLISNIIIIIIYRIKSNICTGRVACNEQPDDLHVYNWFRVTVIKSAL